MPSSRKEIGKAAARLMDAAQSCTEDRVAETLLATAARLVELSAYELARSDRRGPVARLIMISAELDRMVAKSAGGTTA